MVLLMLDFAAFVGPHNLRSWSEGHGLVHRVFLGSHGKFFTGFPGHYCLTTSVARYN